MVSASNRKGSWETAVELGIVESPLVYFLSYSALFVYFPPAAYPAPPPPSLSAMATQKAGAGQRMGGVEERAKERKGRALSL